MSREERSQHRLAMTMAEDRQVDFGTFLRRAREQRGVSLQDLAVTTKISARVLEALERNDPSKLPGGIFSRAFVRAYAREVGLDPDVAAANFVAAFPEESGADEMPATTSAVEVESFEQRRRLLRVSLRVVAAALLVAILAFLYYSRFRPGWLAAGPASGEPPAVAAVTPAPAPLPSAPPAVEPAPSDPAAAAQPDATVAAADTTPASAPLIPATGPAATPGPATDAVPNAVAPSGSADPRQAPLVVVLVLAEPCWLSVSLDGTRQPSRTAGAGERIEFAVQRSITLTAGNAGALSMTLNGKPARDLGAAGKVVTATIPASGFESFLR